MYKVLILYSCLWEHSYSIVWINNKYKVMELSVSCLPMLLNTIGIPLGQLRCASKVEYTHILCRWSSHRAIVYNVFVSVSLYYTSLSRCEIWISFRRALPHPTLYAVTAAGVRTRGISDAIHNCNSRYGR